MRRPQPVIAAEFERAPIDAEQLQREGEYERAIEAARGVLELGLDVQELALLSSSGRYEQAEVVGVEAYLRATATAGWDHARTTALIMAHVVSASGGRHEEGLLWARLAEVAIERTGDPLGLYQAHLEEQRAVVDLRIGERDAAIAGFERAVAIRRAVFGPTHPTLIPGMINAGARARACRPRAGPPRPRPRPPRPGRGRRRPG